MLYAARETRSFVHSRSSNDLNRNRQIVCALVKVAEIIGEAAYQGK